MFSTEIVYEMLAKISQPEVEKSRQVSRVDDVLFFVEAIEANAFIEGAYLLILGQILAYS